MPNSRCRPHRRLENLVRGCCVALAVAAAIAVADVDVARADEPAKLDVVEEMAGALGFADSRSPGFWEALAKAKEQERAAAEAQRASDVAQMIMDAAAFGRRIEEVTGRHTKVTEFIPSPSGDIIDDEIHVRTGEEWVADNGKIIVYMTYWKGLTKLGVVASEIEDGVETVTAVRESEPGSIDVKVGDERPVPPPGSSAAGKKPHSIDPKPDGSLGRASGGQPDGGESHRIKDYSWTAPAETKAPGGAGTRLEFEPIPLPDDRVITPFLEAKPPRTPEDLPHRTGYDVEHPDWDGAIARITAYFDTEGKLAGVVGSVIHDGLETIVAVKELTPGSLGLKKGETRKAPPGLGKGKEPSTWDPNPKKPGVSSGGKTDSSSGGKTGGSSQSQGSTSQNGRQPQQDPERADGERANPSKSQEQPSDDGGAPASGTTSGQSTTSSTGDSQSEYVFLGQGPERENDDGSTSQNTLHQRTEDGVYVQTVTTTQKDGSQSQEKHCFKDSKEVDCGAGMADEPTCRHDCARLAMLAELFACSSGGGGGAECEEPPEGMRRDASAGPDDRCADAEFDTSANHVPLTGGQKEGTGGRLCSYADKPGGPVNYGDPTDPNAPEPPDESQIVHLLNDGVTDPVNPGEPEEILAGSARLDMYGTLRDPADPPGTEDSDRIPGGGPPSTGEAERNPLP